MVSVVGGPTQSQLAEIAGTHHDAAKIIGQVHQHLGALPGLGVFKSHVVTVGIMSDILKMLGDGRADGNAAQAQTQLLAQDLRVVSGPAGGAEARHGDGHHALGPLAQQPHGLFGHQQSQGGIKTAGHADDGAGGVDMLQPAGQGLALKGKDMGTVLVPGGSVGHPGVLRNGAGQFGLKQIHGKGNVGRIRIGTRIAVGFAPVDEQALDVDLRHGHGGQGKGRAFRQRDAVFRNELLAGKHHIRGALAHAGVAQDISAAAAAAVGLHQGAVGPGIACSVMTGAQVGNDGGAVAAHIYRGRRGDPQILADLDAYRKIRQFFALEQKARFKRHRTAAKHDGPLCTGTGLKPAQLLELIIIGQVALGNHTQDLAAIQHGGAVVQLAEIADGQAHRQQQGKGPGGVQQVTERLLGAVLQTFLEEKVSAGVAGEGQLRGHQQPDACFGGLPGAIRDAGGIKGAIRQVHFRRGGGNFDKSVFHMFVSLKRILMLPL